LGRWAGRRPAVVSTWSGLKAKSHPDPEDQRIDLQCDRFCATGCDLWSEHVPAQIEIQPDVGGKVEVEAELQRRAEAGRYVE
jgi:hypothetical protein